MTCCALFLAHRPVFPAASLCLNKLARNGLRAKNLFANLSICNKNT